MMAKELGPCHLCGRPEGVPVSKLWPWLHSSHGRHLGSKLANKSSVCLFLCLSAFQITMSLFGGKGKKSLNSFFII